MAIVGNPESLDKCVSRGRTAAYGVLLQGLFTLSPDMGAGCVLHWIGAAVFAWGANEHAMLANTIFSMTCAAALSPSGRLANSS